jgi:ABC-type enterochelin transport system substrate-binding protein
MGDIGHINAQLGINKIKTNPRCVTALNAAILDLISSAFVSPRSAQQVTTIRFFADP